MNADRLDKEHACGYRLVMLYFFYLLFLTFGYSFITLLTARHTCLIYVIFTTNGPMMQVYIAEAIISLVHVRED